MTTPWWLPRAVYALLFALACALTWRFHVNPTSLMLAWAILFFDVPLRRWAMMTTPERAGMAAATLLPLAVIWKADIIIAFITGIVAIAVMSVIERRVVTR
jgi:hypothetical protein